MGLHVSGAILALGLNDGMIELLKSLIGACSWLLHSIHECAMEDVWDDNRCAISIGALASKKQLHQDLGLAHLYGSNAITVRLTSDDGGGRGDGSRCSWDWKSVLVLSD